MTDHGGESRLSRIVTRGARPPHCGLHHHRGRHASDGTPREDRRKDPRACRPHRSALSRDHDCPRQPSGTGCRHTVGLEEIWSARHADQVVDGSDAFAANPEPDAVAVNGPAPVTPVAPAVESPHGADKSRTPRTSSSAAATRRLLHRYAGGWSLTTTLTCCLLVVLLSSALVVAMLLSDAAPAGVSLQTLVDMDELAPAGTRAVAMAVGGILVLIGALWSAGYGARACHRAARRAHAAGTSLPAPDATAPDATAPAVARDAEDAQGMTGRRAERRG